MSLSVKQDSQSKVDNSKIHELLSKINISDSHRIHLVASENIMSPLARLPFILDCHGRYFLDDIRRFSKWYFPSGREIEDIENSFLLPLLKELFEAEYADVRPISGMNCMTIALSALANIGDSILSIPLNNGGHASTKVVANRLGLNVYDIPFSNAYDIDMNQLEQQLKKIKPALVYIDQSTFIFPIDPQPIRNLIEAVSPSTILHYDTSHINGLIAGKSLFNPLKRGAHCIGGSTHKTLPGPHKGVLLTDSKPIADSIQKISDHFISHHHTASSISLTISLMEMKYCGGNEYAQQTIANAKTFAKCLSSNGFYVPAIDRGFSDTHQVWALPEKIDADNLLHILLNSGIVVTRFDGLPGIGQAAFRLSTSELTKRGGVEKDVICLAKIICELQIEGILSNASREQLSQLLNRLSSVHYCYKTEDIATFDLPKNIMFLIESISSYCRM